MFLPFLVSYPKNSKTVKKKKRHPKLKIKNKTDEYKKKINIEEAKESKME